MNAGCRYVVILPNGRVSWERTQTHCEGGSRGIRTLDSRIKSPVRCLAALQTLSFDGCVHNLALA